MNIARDYTHCRLSPERSSINRYFSNGLESPLCKPLGHCPGFDCAKNILERYGEQLAGARYRYDERQGAGAIVKIVAAESG